MLWDYEVADFLKNIRTQKTSTHPFFSKLKKQLDEYFSGHRKKFDIPLTLNGTEFQLKAWKTLQKIPYGKTLSYTEQAQALNSQAVRAIGTANSKNPINIIIPCHRVTRQDGSLGGYAGGVTVKRNLLQIENSL